MKLSALFSRIVPVLCVLTLASGIASATPVLVREVGTSYGMTVGSLKLPVSSSAQNYFSGLQKIQIDNADTLLAFCIDPFQWSSGSNTGYDQSADFNGFFGSKAGAVAKLYSLFYTDTLSSNLNAAGFQLALWELVADSSVNLAAGVVATTSGTNASIKSTAQAMLNALAGPAGSDQFLFTLYTSATNQDFLVATLSSNEVPEPQAYALLALGLGLLVGLRRQKQK